jgi:phosphoribosylformylglycinamidine cyclo-ligase
LDTRRWALPPVFRWLGDTAAIPPMEMARTFNCGIGMVAVVAPDAVEGVTRTLEAHGEQVRAIGRIVPREAGSAGTIMLGLEGAWPG